MLDLMLTVELEAGQSVQIIQCGRGFRVYLNDTLVRTFPSYQAAFAAIRFLLPV